MHRDKATKSSLALLSPVEYSFIFTALSEEDGVVHFWTIQMYNIQRYEATKAVMHHRFEPC